MRRASRSRRGSRPRARPTSATEHEPSEPLELPGSRAGAGAGRRRAGAPQRRRAAASAPARRRPPAAATAAAPQPAPAPAPPPQAPRRAASSTPMRINPIARSVERGARGVSDAASSALSARSWCAAASSPRSALEPLFAQQREKGAALDRSRSSQRNARRRGDVAQALADECGLPFVARDRRRRTSRRALADAPADHATPSRTSVLVVGRGRRRASTCVVRRSARHRRRSTTCARSSASRSSSRVAPRRGRRRRHQPRLRARRTTTASSRATTSSDDEEELVDILDSDDDAPIIRWVNGLFSQAVQRARERHPHRAGRERGHRALPHRRRALRGQARQPRSSWRRSSRA